MKENMTGLILCGIVLLTIAGCGAPALGASSAAPGPAAVPASASNAPAAVAPAGAANLTAAPSAETMIAVARSYVDAANAGDFNKALAFYAPDAVVSNPLGLFVGTSQISSWLADDVKTTRAKPAEWTMEGPFVVNTGSVSLDRMEKAGVGPVQYRAEYRIGQDGKIHWFAPRVQLTPQQQDVMRAAQAAAKVAPLPASSLIAVAKGYTDAVNAGGLDKALAYYADHAVVSNPLGLFVGKEAIRGWLANDIKTTRSSLTEWSMQPPFVVASGNVQLDRYSKLGIGPVKAIAEFQVQDGKIVLFHPRVILTPGQTAAVKAGMGASPTKQP